MSKRQSAAVPEPGARKRMAMFDALPPPVRAALREFPIDLHPQRLYDAQRDSAARPAELLAMIKGVKIARL